MYKAMVFLRRRDGVSRQELREWWVTRHRLLAEQLPGLQRHAFNLLPQGADHDAVVEQWFDTDLNRRDCYASELGVTVARDTASMVSHRERLFVDEQVFIPDRDAAA